MTTNYPTAPPSYTGPTNKISTATPDEEAAQPLLNSRAGPSAGFGGYYDQPDAGDVPDDFKVCIYIFSHGILLTCSLQYGTSVADSAPEIRNAFVRKVYTILCEFPTRRFFCPCTKILHATSSCPDRTSALCP